MADEPTDESTQKSRPKKGEPVEIPVPSKSQIMRDFEKVATSERDQDHRQKEDGGETSNP